MDSFTSNSVDIPCYDTAIGEQLVTSKSNWHSISLGNYCILNRRRLIEQRAEGIRTATKAHIATPA